MIDLNRILIAPTQTLREAMVCIDEAASGIALVVDDGRRLLFTLTDGDIRRAILHGLSLELTAGQWAEQRPEQGNRRPTTAPIGTRLPELLCLMELEGIRHIPLVDDGGRVVDLAGLSELVAEPAALTALVMAGGEGQRLRPLTGEMPKPMLPVGDRPLMEHIVGHLREAGITQLSIATHYKAQHIVDHFGDGRKFGVSIDYVNEEEPLGTAGALALAQPWTATLLVMNGDILTRMNYGSMLAFHRENRALMTVAVRQYDVRVPYGVVETRGVDVQAVREKPVLQLFVNAGVYLLEPGVQQYVTSGERLDMTQLIERLLQAGQRVVSFPVSEYWIDIGQQDDYAQVQADVKQGRLTV
jgi:dTDP-glucose pyrophosphorylase/CBS domain-containing protein